jgi:REP element-mobilizing transposase RayT
MFHRRKLPHLQRDNKPHFITFVSHHRWMLPEQARDIVLKCCLHDHGLCYYLHAAVIMPDHVHLILVPLVNLAEKRVYWLPEILDAIKGASAHFINHALNRHGRVWQDEYFDHVLRSSESLDQKIEYVLNNPLRRGLVRYREEYQWTWIANVVTAALGHPAELRSASQRDPVVP